MARNVEECGMWSGMDGAGYCVKSSVNWSRLGLCVAYCAVEDKRLLTLTCRSIIHITVFLSPFRCLISAIYPDLVTAMYSGLQYSYDYLREHRDLYLKTRNRRCLITILMQTISNAGNVIGILKRYCPNVLGILY